MNESIREKHISSQIRKLLIPCMEYFGVSGGNVTPADNKLLTLQKEFEKVAQQAASDMDELLNIAKIILPNEVHTALFRLSLLLSARWREFIEPSNRRAADDLRTAEIDVYNTIRIQARTKPRSDDMKHIS